MTTTSTDTLPNPNLAIYDLTACEELYDLPMLLQSFSDLVRHYCISRVEKDFHSIEVCMHMTLI